jgi:integrase
MALTKKCRHDRKRWSRCGCSWYWTGYIDGRREYRNLGPVKTEARRLEAQIEADRLSGRARPVPRDSTLAAVAERWLDHLESIGRRPQTIRAYRTAANAVERYFGADSDVKRIDADAMVEFDASAHASRRGHGGQLLMQALRGILKQAHREHLIASIPTPPLERRSIAANANVRMSEAETVATVAALSPAIPWRDLGDFIVLTGLRISEALALRWADFDAKARTLSVEHSAEQRGAVDAPTKTAHSKRRIRLEDEVVALLERQERTDERIFPRRYAAASAAIRRAMKRAGTYRRDRGWHSLRHTNTALRDRAGQSIRQTAAELGHGPNFVMSASYGWATEAAEPAPVSKVRQRPPSST